MPAAPILILLRTPLAPPDAAGGAREQESERVILGLGLVAARGPGRAAGRLRAGLCSVGRWRATAGAVEFAGWSHFAASSDSFPRTPAPCHCACRDPGGDRLARTAGGCADRAGRLGGDPEPDRHASPPHRRLSALACARREGRRARPDRGRGRLARRFGPPAPIPAGIDPIVVETPADVRLAERRLLRALVKDTDGFMARHVDRPISLAVSRLLAPTRSRRTR